MQTVTEGKRFATVVVVVFNAFTNKEMVSYMLEIPSNSHPEPEANVTQVQQPANSLSQTLTWPLQLIHLGQLRLENKCECSADELNSDMLSDVMMWGCYTKRQRKR